MMRWYKRDLRAMRRALDHVWLSIRPVPHSFDLSSSALDEAHTRFWALDRATLLIGHIASLVELYESQAMSQSKAAKHFASTRVYGNSTEKMVERFENLAAETHKDAARLRALIERVKNEGLPSEIISYAPTWLACRREA